MIASIGSDRAPKARRRFSSQRAGAALIDSGSACEALPRAAFLRRGHARRMRHRLGLRQSDLSHEGAHHFAADMRMCLTGAAALAIVAIIIVIIGMAPVPMVGLVMVGVVPAPIIAVAVAVMMTRVTVLGVEVVRLRHGRPRNANEKKRQ
jgi:hypothetical protein